MTLWRITKTTFCTVLIALISIGVLLAIGDAMLEGEAYATFFGYKLSNNFVYDNGNFIHMGDAIVIYDAPEYEYHHDTPIAYFEEENNCIYIYRIIHYENGSYRVVDPCGTTMTISPQNIIGRVLEY